MGPPSPPDSATLVYESAQGSYVRDVDGNQYLDLAAGFGSMLLGHGHPRVLRALTEQAGTLLQALGDVYPSREKIELSERLSTLIPGQPSQVVMGQSGADAVTGALKTATLFTGRPGWIAMGGSYHGLGYASLAVTSLRSGYRAPFESQLNSHVDFCHYPHSEEELPDTLAELERLLKLGLYGAVILEPILGRGGCSVPPPGALQRIAELTRKHGALLIADEIWTGLGRTGSWLRCDAVGVTPDLVTLGKGLGGGLPISACLGRAEVMAAWQQPQETVHTSTFTGTPLACRTAAVTLDVLSEEGLVQRSAALGARWLEALRAKLSGNSRVHAVRGAGMMIGIDFGPWKGGASVVQRELVRRGIITSTGGGAREVLVLTPALNVPEDALLSFVAEIAASLQALAQ